MKHAYEMVKIVPGTQKSVHIFIGVNLHSFQKYLKYLKKILPVPKNKIV